jgi:predicted nuclease with TOPRIM domain
MNKAISQNHNETLKRLQYESARMLSSYTKLKEECSNYNDQIELLRKELTVLKDKINLAIQEYRTLEDLFQDGKAEFDLVETAKISYYELKKHESSLMQQIDICKQVRASTSMAFQLAQNLFFDYERKISQIKNLQSLPC